MRKVVFVLIVFSAVSYGMESLPGLSYVKRGKWSAEKAINDGSLYCYQYQGKVLSNYFGLNKVLSFHEILKRVYRNGRIIVHHSALPYRNSWSDLTSLGLIDQIHRKENQWMDLGYHFLIGKDGTIYEGRSLLLMGGHAGLPRVNKGPNCNLEYNNGEEFIIDIGKDMDFQAIGIALMGNYDSNNKLKLEKIPFLQVQSLKKLVNYLVNQFEIKTIHGHQYYKSNPEISGGGTTCPGEDILNLLENNYASMLDSRSYYESVPSTPILCKVKCIAPSKRK